MECVINDTRLKFDNGEIYSWIKRGNNPNVRWFLLKGCLSYNSPYRRITINKKTYQYHRVIYQLHNPEWDIDESYINNNIDHIDQNKLNNDITNLRVLSNQKNCFNRTCKGYWYDKKRNNYRVSIMFNGEKKRYTVYTEDDAIKLRAELKNKYHTI